MSPKLTLDPEAPLLTTLPVNVIVARAPDVWPKMVVPELTKVPAVLNEMVEALATTVRESATANIPTTWTKRVLVIFLKLSLIRPEDHSPPPCGSGALTRDLLKSITDLRQMEERSSDIFRPES